MQIQTVHSRILMLTVSAVATPIVAVTLRWVLADDTGKYASLWFTVVAAFVLVGLGSLARSALNDFEKTPKEPVDETLNTALKSASEALAVAEDKIRVLESQNERLQVRAVTLETRVRELEEEALEKKEEEKPSGIIDGLRTVIGHGGERVVTTLTGGSQLEVGVSLCQEEVAGVESMLDSLGRKLARPQVEEIMEAKSADNSTRILIVEDDFTSRRLIQALLPKDMKVSVSEAEDGQAALRILEKPPYPDIIICDVLMPNMDGLEFLTHIRDLPSFSTTPVVMISANAFKDNVTKAAALKVSRFLKKPLDRGELNDAIAGALKEVSTKQSKLVSAQQRLCLDDKAYFELATGFCRAISESITFVRSSISRDRWQAATIRINALAGSIQMVGDERLSAAVTRVEAQLRRTDINGVTVELEMLEQENERFMRTLVHVFNAGEEAAGAGAAAAAAPAKTVVAVSLPD